MGAGNAWDERHERPHAGVVVLFATGFGRDGSRNEKGPGRLPGAVAVVGFLKRITDSRTRSPGS